MNKVLLRSDTKLNGNTIKYFASSQKSMRILTFQMGRPETHTQYLWQLLFVPYTARSPYVFHSIRPPNEFRWSFSARLPILDWSKPTMAVQFVLPRKWPNFNQWDLRGSLQGSSRKSYAPFYRCWKRNYFSAFGYCLYSIHRRAAVILMSWGKPTCWGWQSANMKAHGTLTLSWSHWAGQPWNLLIWTPCCVSWQSPHRLARYSAITVKSIPTHHSGIYNYWFR